MKNKMSNLLTWSDTPFSAREKNIGWSQDGTVRVYESGGTQIDSNGDKYNNLVAYILYYENNDNIVYLKDVRSGVLYNIPSGAKAKGYTLAFKLNIAYNEAL